MTNSGELPDKMSIMTQMNERLVALGDELAEEQQMLVDLKCETAEFCDNLLRILGATGDFIRIGQFLAKSWEAYDSGSVNFQKGWNFFVIDSEFILQRNGANMFAKIRMAKSMVDKTLFITISG